MPTDEFVRSYYARQASEHGAAPSSTMLDEITRERESVAIQEFVAQLASDNGFRKILEIGCGNGHLLAQLCDLYGSRFALSGLDATPEMIAVAQARGVACQFSVSDVAAIDAPDASFDALISQRVLINLLTEEKQVRAFAELARVVRPGGRAILIEGFRSGLENLNRARAEFVLEAIPEPEVNFWFTEERWQLCLGELWREESGISLDFSVPENFLSTHYFMTRFFHDLVRPEGGKIRNTEFARFFATALPPVGDYSPLRLKLLRRR